MTESLTKQPGVSFIMSFLEFDSKENFHRMEINYNQIPSS